MKQNLAINGGPKAIDTNLDWPICDETDVDAVVGIICSGKWGNPVWNKGGYEQIC